MKKLLKKAADKLKSKKAAPKRASSSSNVGKMLKQLRDLGFTVSHERIAGSHYQISVQKSTDEESKIWGDNIKEHATSAECAAFVKAAKANLK